jgi:drug/metabolite transporter (DMT)-like permease
LLPLALALTIRQLEAFIWVALAARLYHEKVTRRQWIALAFGFVGVCLVMRPALALNMLGASVALMCACTGAIVRVLSRELSRTEDSATIVFFNFTQWTILTLCIAPWAWEIPHSADWTSLLGMGVIILLSQWLQTEGMALVPAPRLAPWRNAEIFFAGLLGWILWHEPVGGWFLAGSSLIIIGGVMATWQRNTVPTPV